MSVIQAAKAFLDENKIMVNKKDLNALGKPGTLVAAVVADYNTVSRTEELTGQQLRGRGNPTAVETIGRTLGVGEADEVVEQLNKESRKNPEVTTGLGTGTQKLRVVTISVRALKMRCWRLMVRLLKKLLAVLACWSERLAMLGAFDDYWHGDQAFVTAFLDQDDIEAQAV